MALRRPCVCDVATEDDQVADADVDSLKWVGPRTAPVLRDADITAEDVREKRVSHAQLVETGVNPGVAAKIRREHSLSWSFSGGKDLDRRAKQVRGLQDDEREWVAASYDEWEAPDADASTDGSGDAVAAEEAWRTSRWPGESAAEHRELNETAERAWQAGVDPTPVTEVYGIGEATESKLAEAGVMSVRRLATCNAEHVAEALEVSVNRVREWRDAARELDD
jgi:predicted flap endonuclease-1-like 5' DNA nuclease